jgi:hypothetical protein
MWAENSKIEDGMDKHTDFHFALDLQKRGGITLDS